jgi:hypothetical protein
MANTYNWMIASMQCYPEKDGMLDVVFIVNWQRQATDGTHSAYVYGSQLLTLDPAKPFMPYEDLTFEQVCGWLESAMGKERVAELDAELDRRIEDQINPPIVSPPLPWSTPSASLTA